MNRKYIYIIFVLSLFTVNCKTNKCFQETEKNVIISNQLGDSISFELCQMYGFDQGIRIRGFANFKETTRFVDSVNFFKLVGIVKKYGFPNEKLLGDKNTKYECVQAAAMSILLHNPHMLILNKEYFDLFLNEVNKGNLDRNAFATILDKYYWTKNKGKVLYGSQFGMPCYDSKEETNKARISIGLEALPDSLFKKCK